MNFQKNWGWYDLVATYADGDLIKINSLMDVQLKSFLNHLSWVVTKKQFNKK